MNPTGFLSHCNDAKRDANSLDKLQDELNSIRNDIKTIKLMEISEEAKKLPLEELENQVSEIKERMHNAIDEI